MYDKNIINTINNEMIKLTKSYLGLYFYGSRYKGTDRDDSDYDIILILKNEAKYEDKKKIYHLIGNLEYLNNIFIDIKIMTNSQLKINPYFYKEVINGGKYYEGNT